MVPLNYCAHRQLEFQRQDVDPRLTICGPLSDLLNPHLVPGLHLVYTRQFHLGRRYRCVDLPAYGNMAPRAGKYCVILISFPHAASLNNPALNGSHSTLTQIPSTFVETCS
jgi:hypothetical protein